MAGDIPRQRFVDWGDPRVQALLKDPANAPLPIVNRDLEKMLTELRAPDEP